MRGAACSTLSWRRLVEDEPVHPDLPYVLDEPREVDWFADVAVRAKLVAAQEVGLLLGRREDHHGQELRLRVRAQLPKHFEAVDLRQLQVEQHDLRVGLIAFGVRAAPEQPVKRFGAVANDDDAITDGVLRESAQSE